MHSQSIHDLAVSQLPTDYTAEQYRAAVEAVMAANPELAELARPTSASETVEESLEQAALLDSKAWAILVERDITNPTDQQYADALKEAAAPKDATAAAKPQGPGNEPIGPVQPIRGPGTGKTEEAANG